MCADVTPKSLAVGLTMLMPARPPAMAFAVETALLFDCAVTFTAPVIVGFPPTLWPSWAVEPTNASVFAPEKQLPLVDEKPPTHAVAALPFTPTRPIATSCDVAFAAFTEM